MVSLFELGRQPPDIHRILVVLNLYRLDFFAVDFDLVVRSRDYIGNYAEARTVEFELDIRIAFADKHVSEPGERRRQSPVAFYRKHFVRRRKQSAPRQRKDIRKFHLAYRDIFIIRSRVRIRDFEFIVFECIVIVEIGVHAQIAEHGRFHIRLGFAEGVAAVSDSDSLRVFFSDLFLSGSTDKRQYAHQITPVPGGLDILFPLIKLEDLELLQDCQARFYGDYTRPGTEVRGAWDIDFQLEYHPSVTLDWTGDLAGRQVRRVTVSPLSVTMYSNDVGGFHRAVLYAVKKDGSTVAAEPDTGSYSNSNWESDGEPIWDTYNTWKFEAPVDLEELNYLTLMDQTIPVH